MQDKEVWKDIPGYEGHYQVSTHGGVRSTGLIINGRKTRGKVLRLHISKKGYLCVRLGRKLALVHRLVALTFIPNPKNKPCVGHKDTNRTNAHVSNLEWVTYSENNHNPITLSKNRQSAKKRMADESNKKEISDSIRKKYKEDLGYRNRVRQGTIRAMNRPDVKLKQSRQVERVVDGIVVESFISIKEASRSCEHCAKTIVKKCNEFDVNPSNNGWRWKR